MKFYQINIKITGLGQQNNRPNKNPPSAFLEKEMTGWEFVYSDDPLNDEANVGKIYSIYTPDNIPTFDYFTLKELYGKRKRTYEWILLDVYGMASGFLLAGDRRWLVSKKLKNLLERFRLPKHRFYPAKLMFRGEKLDYFVFQKGEFIDIIFGLSTFSIKEEFVYDSNNPFIFPDEATLASFEAEKVISSGAELEIIDNHSYAEVRNNFRGEHRLVQGHHYVFPYYYDFIFSSDSDLGLIASESLKLSLEEAGVIGLEFIELGDRSVSFLNQTGM